MDANIGKSVHRGKVEERKGICEYDFWKYNSSNKDRFWRVTSCIRIVLWIPELRLFVGTFFPFRDFFGDFSGFSLHLVLRVHGLRILPQFRNTRVMKLFNKGSCGNRKRRWAAVRWEEVLKSIWHTNPGQWRIYWLFYGRLELDGVSCDEEPQEVRWQIFSHEKKKFEVFEHFFYLSGSWRAFRAWCCSCSCVNHWGATL